MKMKTKLISSIQRNVTWRIQHNDDILCFQKPKILAKIYFFIIYRNRRPCRQLNISMQQLAISFDFVLKILINAPSHRQQYNLRTRQHINNLSKLSLLKSDFIRIQNDKLTRSRPTEYLRLI